MDDQLIVSLRERNSANQVGAPPQNNIQTPQEYLMVLSSQRIHYEIQMASGWDNGYPPEELVGLMQTSSGKGWHTPRFCVYPQDLVIRFSCGLARVRKIQILSHQFKIASRLDFWMGSRKGVQRITTTDTDGLGSPAGGDFDGDYNDDDERLDLIPRLERKSLPVLQFQKLGSVSFDSNAGSNYSGRELKSINVDVEGEYLRIVIRQCHVNHLNIYHQVAIMALNVLGEPLEEELQGESERVDFNNFEIVNGPGQGLSETFLPPSVIQSADASSMPSLSDAVRTLSIAEGKGQPENYMDQDVQKLVSGFIKAKQDAAKVEDFASAKLYKVGYDILIKFADEIQALDIEKQKAVDNDDFDLAQEFKAKVVDVKASMNSKLSLSGFFITLQGENILVSLTPPDMSDQDTESEKSMMMLKSFSTGNLAALSDHRRMSNSSVGSSGGRIPVSRRSIPSPASLNRGSSTASDHSSDPEKAKHRSYPRILPTSLSGPSLGDTRHAKTESASRIMSPPRANTKSQNHTKTESHDKDHLFNPSDHQGFGQDEISMTGLNELTEQEKASFAVSLQVFSNKVVSCVLSRELQFRLYALEFVKEHLENENVEDETNQRSDQVLLARAVLQIISIALTDTREKVLTLALALLDQVVKFCLQNEIPSSVTYRSLEPIFSLMLVKASDLNTRVAQGTMDRVVMLCNCFRVAPYAILPLVFKPARSTVLYKQSQSRIAIVARLVDEFGVFDRAEGKGTAGGIAFEDITEFATPYLSHTNGEVRIAARRLIIDVCKFLNKTRVEQFLPGVKPLIIESIQRELVPKKSRSLSASSPAPSRPASRSSERPGQPRRQTLNTSTVEPSAIKRKQVPTPLGVNLHMDSLKSLLVEPESPGPSKSSRQTTRQRSDAAIAHQARVKLPLRSSIKATQALYSGVSSSMVKKQSALSPDEELDTTASEEGRPSTLSVPSSTSKPSQRRARSSSSRTPSRPQQDARSDRISSFDTQKNFQESNAAKDRFCVFCDERNSAFSEEGLVVHYWNDCAMLANCPYCKIIIEISTLSDHTLDDCPKRKFVKQCENCKVIMAADAFLAHVAAGCMTVAAETVRCPLCRDILPSNDEADWKSHLLGGSGCPMNKKSRPRNLLPKTPTQVHSISPAPQVATSQRLSQRIPISTPTSPQSSSSSSSARFEPSVRNRGALYSPATSP